jgi:hypothetical protein
MISINSFLPIPVSLKASAALKFGMLSYGCSARVLTKIKMNIAKKRKEINNWKEVDRYHFS